MHALLDPARRPVIAHRGNRAHAPENTLESFGQALALRVDAVEFDVHLSRDGIPVVLHDPTVERTTNGHGFVAALTLAELKRLDAGARFTPDGGRTFPYRGRGITIPTLDEALAAIGALPFIIEMKTLAVARPTFTVLERAHALSRVLIGSFLGEALTIFRAAGVPITGAPRALARLYLPALFGAQPGSLPFEAICIPRVHRGLPLPVRQFARVMRALGGTTHLWTVNDPSVARRLWALGVNGIISDDPRAILAARGGPA